MKAYLISAVLVCCLGIKAQSVHSYHGGYITGAVSVGASLFYTEKIFDGCCAYVNQFVKAENGTVVARTSLSGAFTFSNTPLITATADHQLVAVSGSIVSGSCDNAPFPGLFIVKFDTASNIIWKKAVSKNTLNHIIGLQDSSIVYVSNDRIYRINSTGSPIDSLTTVMGLISSVNAFNKENFLVSYSVGSSTYLRKISNDLVADTPYPIGTNVENLQVLADSSVIVLSAGNISQYDKSFVWQKTSGTQTLTNGYAIKAFSAVGDSIFCTGKGYNDPTELHYSILDKSFNQLYQ